MIEDSAENELQLFQEEEFQLGVKGLIGFFNLEFLMIVITRIVPLDELFSPIDHEDCFEE